MTFEEWYKGRYKSGSVYDYVEYDYYSSHDTTPVDMWWLDRELKEAFKAGQAFQRQKEYEFGAI